MRQDRVYKAARDIVEILEKNVQGVRQAMASEIEDLLNSVGALLGELDEEQLNKANIQDVLAFLLDSLIGDVLDFGDGLPSEADEDLMVALEDYMHVMELKFNRKSNAIRSERLRLVFENFWEDSGDDDGEGEPDHHEEGSGAAPEAKTDQGETRSPAPKSEEKLAPETADVDAEAEEE